jgi:hypothetical protein
MVEGWIARVWVFREQIQQRARGVSGRSIRMAQGRPWDRVEIIAQGHAPSLSATSDSGSPLHSAW